MKWPAMVCDVCGTGPTSLDPIYLFGKTRLCRKHADKHRREIKTVLFTAVTLALAAVAALAFIVYAWFLVTNEQAPPEAGAMSADVSDEALTAEAGRDRDVRSAPRVTAEV